MLLGLVSALAQHPVPAEELETPASLSLVKMVLLACRACDLDCMIGCKHLGGHKPSATGRR